MTNLRELSANLPKKPSKYTTDHPVTIEEGLHKYCNTRTVHSLEVITDALNQDYWPLPLWVDPQNVKVGFSNKMFYILTFLSWSKTTNSSKKTFLKRMESMLKFKPLDTFDWQYAIILQRIGNNRSYDTAIAKAFESNLSYIQKCLSQNKMLMSKEFILNEVFSNYKRKNWASCICLIFPLVDFIARNFLSTSDLKSDVKKICTLFEKNDLGLEKIDFLMPHVASIKWLQKMRSNKDLGVKDYENFYNQILIYRLGIIGPALSSFIRFSYAYYGYYKEDVGDINVLNRHAILHGSVGDFNNRINTIKLLTYLFLMLELEPVFKNILRENGNVRVS